MLYSENLTAKKKKSGKKIPLNYTVLSNYPRLDSIGRVISRNAFEWF